MNPQCNFMMSKQHQFYAGVLAVGVVVFSMGISLYAEESEKKKKLKIVFLMGQSNMVGYSTPKTAWYLTQPMYVPPAETATARGKYYDDSFYWQGLDFAEGDSEGFNARGEALKDERSASRKLWRSRVYGNFSRTAQAEGKTLENNDWNYEEWGPPPIDEEGAFRSRMYEFLNQKAEKEGIHQRMVEHIESPENKRHPKVVLAELGQRDELIAEDLKRVREIFTKGASTEDFDRLEAATKEFGRVNHENREAYARLVEEHVNLPIAERTYISAYGELSGAETDHKSDRVTQGVLSIGYGKHSQSSGPEYAFGISYERLVDGPVLLVKCSWGGTSVHSAWRPPSLANTETPIEKASREAKNKADAELAKANGSKFTPTEPLTGPGPIWQRALAHIEKVLTNPGAYHPDYDPKAGVELAGLIWFQGWNDLGNEAYGEQLVHLIEDFRKEVKAPELPVVCGLVGHSTWPSTTFESTVNHGMLYAAKHEELKGSVDVVNTVKYFPVELGLSKSVLAAFGEESEEYRRAMAILPRSSSNSGLHYFGSAKFLCLTGNAMARSLVNLSRGNTPTIHKEAEALLKTD